MSESNIDIPVPSQEPETMCASLSNPLDCSNIPDTCAESVVSEVSDNIEKRKSSNQTSKIARPTGLKLPTAGTTTSKIARLCNNATKPPVPLNTSSPPNYSSSLKTTYANTYKYEASFDLRTHTRTSKYVSGDRVSLKDIGIRQPVVHFNMDCKYYGSGIGSGNLMFTPCSMEKMSDKWARKRLTDVNETDENKVSSGEKWTAERKMSSGSVLSDSSRRSTPDELRKIRSSDASYSPDSFSDYWKSDDVDPNHPPDASIVLTENTDQFIIGDRVWVGGVKPGQIAYIGETQFAPGEWAGIVLDEPIGKNDGTVANIRYFQCEPKKGIFSRLTRLTKYPLVDGGAGEPAATRSVPAETKKSNGSLSGSIAKKSPLVLTPTSVIKSSISKPSSPDSGVLASPSLVVGDRVIIKSSQGSKAGILRYIGTTEFAPGEWCGVELDDPLGKNDGSVAGTRYFECQPKFGLFAPLHKVSRSPANKRLFQPCMVHHNRTSLRRQGSKESLVSMSSAASTTASVRSTARKIGVKTSTPTATTARTTLQETLKKKQEHIEQLLKERDLERAEVTRAANQADEAERQLARMKKEFEKYKKEVDAHVAEMDAALCLLKSEKTQLISQIDDEKKKYEDLQFRLEEETIDKADIKATVAQYEEKLNLLQKTLLDERRRAENLESESNKLFEAEEQMVIVKDELDSTKEELETHKRLRSTLEQKHISLEAHLTAARAEIESLKIENQSLKETVSKDENNTKESLASAIQNLEQAKKELERKEGLVDQLSKEVESKNRDAADKEKELEAKYASLVQDLSEKHRIEIVKLKADLNANWEIKLKVLETQIEDKIKETKTLEGKLENCNIALSKNNVEKAAESARQQEAEAKLQMEVKEAVEELKKKAVLLDEEVAKSENLNRDVQTLNSELEKTKALLSAASDSTDKRVQTLNELIDQQKKELDVLKGEIEVKSNELTSLKVSEAQTTREHEEKLNQISALLQKTDLELKKSREESIKAEEDFMLKLKEMRDMNHTNEEAFKLKIKHLEDTEAETKSELERLSRDLETSRNSLEARESELKSEQGNSKNLAQKLMALEENYRKVSEEKDRIELEAGDVSRKLQSTEEKLVQVTNQKSKLEADISTFISSSNDSSVQMTKLNEDLRTKEKEMDALREELSDKSRQFERVEQELRQCLEKQEENISRINSEREKERQLHSEELTSFREKLEASALAFKKAEDDSKQKVTAATENAQAKIKDLEEKIKTRENESAEDRNRYERHVKELLDVHKDLEKKLDQMKTQSGQEKNSLQQKIQELTAERTNLLEVAEKTKADFLTTEKKVEEKAKKDAQLHASEKEKLENELKDTKETLSRTLDEFNRTKVDKNKLEEENSNLEKLRSQAEDMLKSIQEKNSQFQIRLSSAESENQVLKETITQLREEKCSLEKDATNKMMLVTELKMQIKLLEDTNAVGEAETETRVKNLQAEFSNVEQLLRKTEAARAEEKSKNIEKIRDLEGEILKLKQESSQLISRKEKDVENVNVVALQTRKELNEKTRECTEKAGMIENLEKTLQSVAEELNGERMRREDAENRCISFEKEILHWKEKVESQGKLLQNSTDMVGKVADISQKLAEAEKREQELLKHSKSEREGLVNLLETTKTLLNQQEMQTKTLSGEVESLKLEKAEWQKKLLQDSENASKSVKPEEDRSKNVMSEADFEKGQIDFLNSVIVDMQKKNDALKARIEILEMGYSPEDVEEFNLHNINARSVAPRLFCDICDRFDLHDTEDCPTQAGDDEPPTKSSKSKAPPPERPYCDICEMFGHDTADCDDAETF